MIMETKILNDWDGGMKNTFATSFFQAPSISQQHTHALLIPFLDSLCEKREPSLLQTFDFFKKISSGCV